MLRRNRVATAQGKQGIWFLLFPDRENTGNFVVTQGKFLRHGKYFWLYLLIKKHVFLYIFSEFFSLASLGIISHFKLFLYELFRPIYLLYYVTFLQVSTKPIQAVFKTNSNNVIGNMYNYFFKCNMFLTFQQKYEMSFCLSNTIWQS